MGVIVSSSPNRNDTALPDSVASMMAIPPRMPISARGVRIVTGLSFEIRPPMNRTMPFRMETARSPVRLPGS